MTDYKTAALEYMEYYMDITGDFCDGTYNTIYDLAEYLLGGCIPLELEPGLTDEEQDAEADRFRIEIFEAIDARRDDIKKGLLMRSILNIVYKDPEIKALYNDNMWDIYGELDECYGTLEELEQINKNLGGEGVTV